MRRIHVFTPQPFLIRVFAIRFHSDRRALLVMNPELIIEDENNPIKGRNQVNGGTFALQGFA
jgi:hypothetical protein